MNTAYQEADRNGEDKRCILFINQFDVFMNNSAGITVRDMFGDELCRKMPKIFAKGNQLIFEQEDRKETFSFGLSNWRKVVSFLKKTKPDIVYTTASASKVLLFLIYVKKKLGIPVLIHYFDNWREIGSVRRKNRLLRLLGWPRERALVISEEMNAYYQRKYGGKYTTIMVGTATEDHPVRHEKKPDGKIKLLYAGGLHLGRVDALTDIEKILLEDFQEIQLVIATFSEGEGYNRYHTRFDEQKTRFLTDIRHEEMNALYAEADALLFVESAPEEKLNYLRYSMSTKIPEYLSSGLPILCYARPGIASYEYFRRTGTALLASTPDEARQALKIIREKDCNDMIAKAQKAAQQDFDREKQQIILWRIMEEMILDAQG